MALPDGFEPKTRDEWSELANSEDSDDRRQVTGALRALGHQPSEYLVMKAEERVDAIMEAQGEDEEKPKRSKKRAAKGAAKKTTKRGRRKAAPVAEEEEEEDEEDEEEEEEEPKPRKRRGKAAKAGATNSAAGGASVDMSGVTGRLDAMATSVQGVEEAVAGLVETIGALAEENASLRALMSDTHFLVRVLVQSDRDLKNNSEDEDLQEALYDQLVVEPEGNDD